jgi:phosphohistidine phosphatase
MEKFMELILWRHAEADDSFSDMERCLTAKGLKQAKRMANFLRNRLPQDTRILVSPAKRAQQTAEALTKNFISEPAIAPNCTIHSLLNAANWPDGDGCVLIVGHQPVLGEVAAHLLCDSPNSFSVKKGAVWWLTHQAREEDSQTSLRLVISPDLL